MKKDIKDNKKIYLRNKFDYLNKTPYYTELQKQILERNEILKFVTKELEQYSKDNNNILSCIFEDDYKETRINNIKESQAKDNQSFDKKITENKERIKHLTEDYYSDDNNQSTDKKITENKNSIKHLTEDYYSDDNNQSTDKKITENKNSIKHLTEDYYSDDDKESDKKEGSCLKNKTKLSKGSDDDKVIKYNNNGSKEYKIKECKNKGIKIRTNKFKKKKSQIRIRLINQFEKTLNPKEMEKFKNLTKKAEYKLLNVEATYFKPKYQKIQQLVIRVMSTLWLSEVYTIEKLRNKLYGGKYRPSINQWQEIINCFIEKEIIIVGEFNVCTLNKKL